MKNLRLFLVGIVIAMQSALLYSAGAGAPRLQKVTEKAYEFGKKAGYEPGIFGGILGRKETPPLGNPTEDDINVALRIAIESNFYPGLFEEEAVTDFKRGFREEFERGWAEGYAGKHPDFEKYLTSDGG